MRVSNNIIIAFFLLHLSVCMYYECKLLVQAMIILFQVITMVLCVVASISLSLSFFFILLLLLLFKKKIIKYNNMYSSSDYNLSFIYFVFIVILKLPFKIKYFFFLNNSLRKYIYFEENYIYNYFSF